MKSYKSDLEAIILGSILEESNTFKRINKLLRVSCFEGKNKFVFEAICKVFESKTEINLITVSRQILLDINVKFEKSKEQYTKINQYLISLCQTVCSTANLEYHALCLYEISLKEELIKELSELIKLINQDNLRLTEDLVFIREKLYEIDSDPITILDGACDYLEKNYPFESEKYQSVLDLAKSFNNFCDEIRGLFEKNNSNTNTLEKIEIDSGINELEHWPEVTKSNKGSPSTTPSKQNYNYQDIPF